MILLYPVILLVASLCSTWIAKQVIEQYYRDEKFIESKTPTSIAFRIFSIVIIYLVSVFYQILVFAAIIQSPEISITSLLIAFFFCKKILMKENNVFKITGYTSPTFLGFFAFTAIILASQLMRFEHSFVFQFLHTAQLAQFQKSVQLNKYWFFFGLLVGLISIISQTLKRNQTINPAQPNEP